ncbi:heavy metal translocating P-type ATPase [Corynebacterium pseudopelargi]|uniref:Putative copper-exporting P-type ATPase V n=1 Tax=Corynebacterium pseudopelargi TaxID=2080757 RepID=A0A3G6IWN5_9CORY|nr:HAD-IC family P-type ATPase [Corynebacterium pseudopelargi]AZA10112.1 putative copper-exporting P-type ATPase V [Corynebacterium pseudopelargi]
MSQEPHLTDPDEQLGRVISQAKEAAALAGVDTRAGVDPEENAQALVHAGKTSFAFELSGLSSATIVGEIEEALSQLNGVDARIVYPSSTAWVSASSTFDPQSIVDVFARFGVDAQLTDSSLRRRVAWSDVEDGRFRRSVRRHRRRASKEQVEQEERQFELARRQGFLERQSDHRRRQASTQVLFTARELITKKRFWVSLAFSIPVLIVSYYPWMQFDYWQWVLAALSAPVVFYGAWPFHRATIGGARRGMSALDSASSVAILLGWFWSLAAMLFSRVGDIGYRADPTWASLSPDQARTGMLFFDVSCGMTCILLAGRLLIRHTRNNLLDDLDRLRTDHNTKVTLVTRHRKNPKPVETSVAVQKLNVGDDILVGPGDLVPVDGVVIGGSSTINTEALGIEPREVSVNDKVYAGSINGDSRLKIRVSHTGHRTWLAEIYRWVADTNVNQNMADDLATRTASTLVPVSFMIAAADFALWALITGNLTQAFASALAVLGGVAPVALAVSASLAMRQGIEGAARRGILIRSGNTLRALDEVDTVIFNRVGALSSGEMHVETVTADRGENLDLVLRVAGALALESDHPVSRALVRAAREARDAQHTSTIPNWIEVSHYELDEDGNFHGMVELPIQNSDGEEELRQVEAILWRPKNLSELDGRLAQAAVSGGTPLVVRWKGKDRGVITLHDDAKDDAIDAVDALEQMGLETMMLSRDTYPVARRYGDTVGVSHVLAGIQPANKAQTVRSVRTHGARIAMVGDDSVRRCFRVANVGIQIGAMSHVQTASAIEHSEADVVMLEGNVKPIPQLFQFARKINRVVHSNIAFAWGYNFLAMLAAIAGVLHPMIATVLMLVSTLYIEVRSNRVGSFAPVSNKAEADNQRIEGSQVA